ncbi:MAG: hypothetical protein ACOX8N_09325 [Christensenellales bacterium]
MKWFCLIIVLLVVLALCLAGCAGSGAKVPQMQEMPTSESAAASAPPASAPDASEESTSVSQDSTPAGTIIEPEQLISRQEAEQLLGEAVREGEKKEQPVVGQKICFYDAQNEDSRSFLQISITQTAFMKNNSQTPESIYATTKEALIETGGQRSINGVGDEYFFGTPGLHILKDGYYLCIAADGPDDDKVHQVLEQAGALAVENLEKALGR